MLKKQGKVVSTKMQKTVVVEVKTRKSHPLYKKIFTVSRKFFVHDPREESQEGDQVEIQECRPLSKKKRWILLNILKKS